MIEHVMRRWSPAALVIAIMLVVAVALAVLLVVREDLVVFATAFTLLLTAGLILSRMQGRLVLSWLFFGVLFVTDVDLYRGAETGGAIHPQLAFKLVLYAVTALIAVLWVRPVVTARGGIVAGIYVAMCIGSAVYSIEPLISLSGGVILACQALLGLAIVSNYEAVRDAERDLNLLGACLFSKAVLSWGLAAAVPDLALSASASLFGDSIGSGVPRLAGLSNPNVTAFNAAVLVIVSTVWLAGRSGPRLRMMGGLALVVGVVTLLGSQSRTSIVATAAGVAAMGVVGRSRRWIVAVLVAVMLVGAVWDWSVSDVARFSSRVGSEEETLSLNGRTQIWRASFDRLSESWIVGFGYGSSRAIVPLLSEIRSPRPFYSAHSLIVESLINVGVIGTSVLLWIVGAMVLRLFRAAESGRAPRTSPLFRGAFGLAVLVVVSGLAESGAAGILTLQGILLFWLFGLASWLVHDRPWTAGPELGG